MGQRRLPRLGSPGVCPACRLAMCFFFVQGHIAVNNSFLVSTSHPLALKYNDMSPLENMHIATAFELANRPGCNVFESLTVEDRREVRWACCFPHAGGGGTAVSVPFDCATDDRVASAV